MKQPSGANQLLLRREKGMHPPYVWVLHGEDQTRRPREVPCLGIKSKDSAASLDWSAVVALPVRVVLREGWSVAAVRLVAAIARFAAPVTVFWVATEDEWPGWSGRAGRCDAGEALFCARKAGQWPAFWSADEDADYRARKRDYFRAAVAAVIGEANGG